MYQMQPKSEVFESMNSSAERASRVHKKTKRKFTQEEDEVICAEVKKGKKSWKHVADLLPGRNCRQVRERWVNYLSPDVKNGPWTDEDDQRLQEFAETMGGKWSKIALNFPSRTDVMLKNRWALLQRRSIRKARISSVDLEKPALDDKSPCIKHEASVKPLQLFISERGAKKIQELLPDDFGELPECDQEPDSVEFLQVYDQKM